MKKTIKIILLLILTFPVSMKEVFATEKIKIGLLVPLTGGNSEIGHSIIKSTRLAVNKIDDLSIEIIPRDTQSNPQGTLNAAKELSNLGEQIKIIIFRKILLTLE
jgi:ABC-type branched-subunit amino acid transport system substrate-binding protein